MKSIGIIGQGFVGTALRKGMMHAFAVYTYDREYGNFLYDERYDVPIYHGHKDEQFGYEYVVELAEGPIFVCVPTPMNPDGSCSTKIVESVVLGLNEAAYKLNKHVVVCIKSTVPPGTTEMLDKQCEHLSVCFNPEFLTERNSSSDFKNQDRIIIGGPRRGTKILKAMYEISYPDVPVTKTSSMIAEMVKYTTNISLAIKVALANELSQICQKLDIDYDKVIEYATKDKRLGHSHWAVPGPDGKAGFGGSCFPKDINALMYIAKKLGVDPKVMNGAWEKNLEIRSEKDWEKLKGRAVVDE